VVGPAASQGEAQLMDQLLELFTSDLVRSGIRLGTPIILAALGGALCSRAGVLNLALEGKMLLGSFVGILGAYYLHNSYLGVLSAAIAGAFVGLIMALLYLRYNVNLIILAIAINLFITEMTVFFMRTYLGDVGTWSDPSIQQLPDIPLALIGSVPQLAAVFSSHNWIVYFSWIATILAFIVLFYAKFGRHIRAVG
jgi:simple sugar transport system permease protein